MLNEKSGENKTFDIVIIGGGFVGLSLAIALAPLSLSIAVVEATDNSYKHDPRYFALNIGSQQFFDHLGVWPLLASAVSSIQSVHISEQGCFHKLRFFAEQENSPALACMTSAQLLLQALYQRLQSFNNITLLQPASLVSLDHSQRQLLISKKDSDKCQAVGGQVSSYAGAQFSDSSQQCCINYRLLVAADGIHSLTRQYLGFETSVATVGTALLCLLESDRACHAVAYQRFSPVGTLALLPIDKQRYKAVITADLEKISYWQHLNDDEFIEKFQKHFAYFAGKFKLATARVSYPVKQLWLEQQVMPGAVIIGNAAHAFSPVAAQSLNLSLQDVSVLANTVTTAVIETKLKDFSSLEVLLGYQQQRRYAQDEMKRLMSLLVTDNKSYHSFTTAMRQFGFIAGEWCLPFHHYLARKFTGIC